MQRLRFVSMALIVIIAIGVFSWLLEHSRPSHAVFFGDSITEGAGASELSRGWVELVQNELGYDIYTNSGIGATVLQNTIQGQVQKINGTAINNGRDTYRYRINFFRPTHVYILYGLNDLRLSDTAFTVENYQNDLGEIVDGVIDSGVPANYIVIGSPPYMKPSSYGSHPPFDAGSTATHLQYVAASKAVAGSRGTRYTDVYQAMLDNGGDAIVSNDGVHPNDAGHRIIASAMILASHR